jgi:hypothetical protein
LRRESAPSASTSASGSESRRASTRQIPTDADTDTASTRASAGGRDDFSEDKNAPAKPERVRPIKFGFGSDGSGRPPETVKSLVTPGAAQRIEEVLSGVWNSALNWNSEAARGVPVPADDPTDEEDVRDDFDSAEVIAEKRARRQRKRAREEAATPEIERVQLVVDNDATLEIEIRETTATATSGGGGGGRGGGGGEAKIIKKLEPIRIPGTYGLRQFYQRLALEFEAQATKALLSPTEWREWQRREFGRDSDREPAGGDVEEDEDADLEGTDFLGDLAGTRESKRQPPPPRPRVELPLDGRVWTDADRDTLTVFVTGYTVRFRGALACYLGYPAAAARDWSPWSDALGNATPSLLVGAVQFARPPSGLARGGFRADEDDQDEDGERNGSKRLRFAISRDRSVTRDRAFTIALLPGGFFERPRTAATKEAKTERDRVAAAERDRRAQLSQSAVALGMDWEDSPPLQIGDSYTLPHPVAASLYARPTFGAGAQDCKPG